jgi:1-deoxy-D-xylulose-5-phosphate reductoisomerase
LPERFRVVAVSANRDVRTVVSQAREFRPQLVALADEAAAAACRQELAGTGIQVLAGEEGLVAVATMPEADVLVGAVVGMAGLVPILAGAKAGKVIALANKESLVVGGQLLMDTACANGAVILPVDSEHSAILQCLAGENRPYLRRLILTASGGPFWGKRRSQLRGVTRREALRHPRWQMGAKISVDSATMMNKGLEVLEAHWLFGAALDAIDVVVHPQSIVHSLVEFQDGSIVAQLGPTDMRHPILYALTYPERVAAGLPGLDLLQVGQLQFMAPDDETFPCLTLAREAGRRGGTAPAALNAANEVAVAAFLQDRIEFLAIPEIVAQVLERHNERPADDLPAVLAADQEGRRLAQQLIDHWEGGAS